jgi:hypothetical protein
MIYYKPFLFYFSIEILWDIYIYIYIYTYCVLVADARWLHSRGAYISYFFNNIFTLITGYISKVLDDFNMFPTNHILFMLTCCKVLRRIVLTNHSTQT